MMRARAIAGFAALAAAAGCALVDDPPNKMPVPAWFGDAAEIEPVRRIMVLPFDQAPGVQADEPEIRRAFLAELAKIQRFQIVPLPSGTADERELYHSLRHGRIRAESLAELGRRYGLDGVLLGEITGFRAYKPPHVGLRVQLVSLHSATTVWAAEALYDANDAIAVEDLRHYSESFMAEDGTMHGWELLLISPSKFTAYVCHRIVGTWRDADL